MARAEALGTRSAARARRPQRVSRALGLRAAGPIALALGVLGCATALASGGVGTVAAVAAADIGQQAHQCAVELDAAQRGVRVTTSAAADLAQQTAQGAAAITALVGDVPVLTSVMTHPLAAHAADDGGTASGAGSKVVIVHQPQWERSVAMVDGRAPQSGGGVEVAAPAASGLAVGDELAVGRALTPVSVVGLWEPRDGDDALWFADQTMADGTLGEADGALGPLFTADAAAVSAVAESTRVRWTVVPRTTELAASGLGELATALGRVPDALRSSGLLIQGAAIDGDGAANLAAIADNAAAAARSTRAVVVLAAVAGLAGIVAAAGAVSALTVRERHLLRSRGARPMQVLLAQTPRIAVGAGLGSLAGGLVSVALGQPGWPAGGAWLIAVVTAAAPAAARLPAERTGPSRQVVLAALGSVVVVMAGLAVWQLVRDPDSGAGSAALAAVLVCAGLAVAATGALTQRLAAHPDAVSRSGVTASRPPTAGQWLPDLQWYGPARLATGRRWAITANLVLAALLGGAVATAVAAAATAGSAAAASPSAAVSAAVVVAGVLTLSLAATAILGGALRAPSRGHVAAGDGEPPAAEGTTRGGVGSRRIAAGARIGAGALAALGCGAVTAWLILGPVIGGAS